LYTPKFSILFFQIRYPYFIRKSIHHQAAYSVQVFILKVHLELVQVY